MKYELSKEQFVQLWDRYNIERTASAIDERINFWNTHIKHQFKLIYTENNFEDDADITDDTTPYGWYGIITGKEKHINWFIIQI